VYQNINIYFDALNSILLSLFSTKTKGLHTVNRRLVLVFCQSNDLDVINFILNKIIKIVEKDRGKC